MNHRIRARAPDYRGHITHHIIPAISTSTGHEAHHVTEVPDQASEAAGGQCQRKEEDPAA